LEGGKRERERGKKREYKAFRFDFIIFVQVVCSTIRLLFYFIFAQSKFRKRKLRKKRHKKKEKKKCCFKEIDANKRVLTKCVHDVTGGLAPHSLREGA